MPYEIEGKSKLAKLIEIETRINDEKNAKKRIKLSLSSENLERFI
jgi:hypothetical protein